MESAFKPELLTCLLYLRRDVRICLKFAPGLPWFALACSHFAINFIWFAISLPWFAIFLPWFAMV